MDSTTLIGTTGATIILIAFIFNQFHKWADTDFIYDLCNFIGSGLLIIYAILLDSIPFLVLNAVWALVSFKDVVTDLQRNAAKDSKMGFYERWMK